MISTTDFLKRKKECFIPCVYHFYEDPPVLDRGNGVWLFDQRGNRYMDLFSGVSVNHLGHGHPAIVEAVIRQISKLSNTTSIYLTEPPLRLAEAILSVAPKPLAKVFFCASGSEANETALFLCRHKTKKRGVVSLSHSLHGNTLGALSMTGLPFWKQYIDPLPFFFQIPTPVCLGEAGRNDDPDGSRASLSALERLLNNTGNEIGTVIVEIILGNGGVLTPPPEFFDGLHRIIQDRGLALIVDEVQTGFGRTGRMFAFERTPLQPDAVTVAKSIGGGLPLGAVLASDAASRDFYFPRASTFGGNPAACAAGLAFLETLLKEGLCEKAEANGGYFKERLNRLMEKHDWIKQTRGAGLMLGMELDPPREDGAAVADRVLNIMKDKGYLIGKGGASRNVLIFQPPLIIEREQIEDACLALDEALSEAVSARLEESNRAATPPAAVAHEKVETNILK